MKRFAASRRTGFYVAVTREGEVSAGDEIRMSASDPNSVPLPWIFRLYIAETLSVDDIVSARRAIMASAMPESWKDYFRERLQTAKV